MKVMNAIKYRISLTIVFTMLLGCVHVHLYSQQSTCLEQYETALEYYETGRIDSTYRILVDCINDPRAMRSMSNSERGKVYKLAAEAAFFLGRYDEAELYTREFRTNRPAYSPTEGDLMEFQDHVQRTRLYPKNVLALKIYYIRTRPELVSHLAPYGPEASMYWIGNVNLAIGLEAKRNIHQRISIGMELKYGDLTNFQIDGSYNPFKEGVSGSGELDLNALQWPLFLAFNAVNTKNSLTYVELGFSLTYPLKPIFYGRGEHEVKKSGQFGKYYFTYNADPFSVSHSSGAFFFDAPLEYNLLIGLGASINIGVISMGLNFRYYPKLTSSNPFEGMSFDDIPENDDLYYIDDIFLLSLKGHFEISMVFGLNMKYQAY